MMVLTSVITWGQEPQLASENVTAFTEIAKKVQMETVEIIMAAGKEMTEEASSGVKKASKDVAAASKKVATVK